MLFEWFDAARRGDETFLRDNINVFARKQDKQGRTALIISIQHRHNSCIDLLAMKEAGIETEKGWTAIMYAIKYDNMTAFKLLLPSEGSHLTKKNILPLYIAIQYTAHEYVTLLLPYYVKDKKHLAEFFRFAVSTADGDTIKPFLPHFTTKQVNNALRAMMPDDLGVLYVYSNLQEVERNAKNTERAKTGSRRSSSIFRKRPSSGYGMGPSNQFNQSDHNTLSSFRTLNHISKASSRPGSAVVQLQPFSGPAQIPPPGRQNFQSTPPMQDYLSSTNAYNRHNPTTRSTTYQQHQNYEENRISRFNEAIRGTDEDDCEIICSEQHIRMQRMQQQQQQRQQQQCQYSNVSPAKIIPRPVSAGSKLSQETPLMHAASIGDLDMAMKSIQYVKHTQRDGTTALMIACDKGHYEIAALLYSYEKQMRRKDGRTALMISIAHGTPELVQMLMESESRYQTEDGKTALMVAAMHGRKDLAVILASKEARMTDIQRTTALIYATSSRREGIVRLLAEVEAGMKTRNGSSALCFAAVLGYTEIVEILLPYEIGIVEGHGRTPLMLACQHGNTDVVQLLSTTKMVGAVDDRGCTALMECAHAGFYQGAKILCEHECQRKNKDGMTAMMYAAVAGNLDIVAILRDHEAGIQSNEGYTALIYGLVGSLDNNTKIKLIEILGLAECDIMIRRGRSTLDYIRDYCEAFLYQALQDMLTNAELRNVVDIVHREVSEDPNITPPEQSSQSIAKSYGSGHASMIPGNISVKSYDRSRQLTSSLDAPGVDIHYTATVDRHASQRAHDSPVESISIFSAVSDREQHVQGEDMCIERKSTHLDDQPYVSMSIASDM